MGKVKTIARNTIGYWGYCILSYFISGQSAQEENSDELVIIAAKQMGKELFASLEIEERKTKLEAMVC